MAHSVTLEAAEPRRVIVHYHLTRCAGTTLATILEREFGDGCYHVHRPSPSGTVDAAALVAFLRATPQARAITSRHVRYPVPRDPVAGVADCFPLRRPLERLESLYNVASADPAQALHPLTADGLARFFTNVAERYPDSATNVQTTALAMRDRYRPAGGHDLETAVRRIEESGFLVLVERFDESMVVAEYLLRSSFPGLLLHYAPERTARAVRPSPHEREQRLRKRCGDEIYATIKGRNELDEALCDAAGAELDRRITFVPAFASRLNEFRARCAALRRDQALLMAPS